MIRRPPTSTLFPSTRLFRSGVAFFAIGEVHGGRAVDVPADAGDPRSHMPDSYQLLASRIRQRLDQHPVEYAENSGIGADSERQRDQRNRREPRRPPQPPHYMLECSHDAYYVAAAASVRKNSLSLIIGGAGNPARSRL